MNTYLIRCCSCGRNTSKSYAREHNGECKACVDPNYSPAESRNARIIEHGYDAYAREEGHYDLPDHA